jgi:threonine/homoserine/homoserine lactone efflux protein
MPTWLVQVLQFAGGFFLLFLALEAYKTWQNYDKDKPAGNKTIRQTIFKAALVNLLNPAPYIGWSLVMGPLFLKGWRQASINGIALLLGFYSILILVTLGVMLVFSIARKTGPRIGRALVGFSAIALSIFGLYEIWLGVRVVWGI